MERGPGSGCILVRHRPGCSGRGCSSTSCLKAGPALYLTPGSKKMPGKASFKRKYQGSLLKLANIYKHGCAALGIKCVTDRCRGVIGRACRSSDHSSVCVNPCHLKFKPRNHRGESDAFKQNPDTIAYNVSPNDDSLCNALLTESQLSKSHTTLSIQDEIVVANYARFLKESVQSKKDTGNTNLACTSTRELQTISQVSKSHTTQSIQDTDFAMPNKKVLTFTF